MWKTSDIASQRAKLTTTVRDVLGGHSIGAWKVEYAVYDQAEVAATRVQQRHRKKARTVASAGTCVDDATQPCVPTAGIESMCNALFHTGSRSPFLQSVVFAGEKPFFLARHTALLQADATLGPSLEFAGTATQRTSGIIEVCRITCVILLGSVSLLHPELWQGVRFALGDFTVCIGACKMKGTYRALVVEVRCSSIPRTPG